MSIWARTTQYIFSAPCNVAISSSTGTTDQGVEGYDQEWDCWLRCTWTHPPMQRPSQDPVWQDHEEDLAENSLQWLWQPRGHLNPGRTRSRGQNHSAAFEAGQEIATASSTRGSAFQSTLLPCPFHFDTIWYSKPIKITWTHPPMQRPSQHPDWQDHEEDLAVNGLQWLWQTRWHFNPKSWPKSQHSIRSWPRNSDTTSTLLHSNPLCWCVPSILILYDIQTRYLIFIF